MIAALNESRAAAGRSDDDMMIGHIAPFLYVGTPDWEVGPGVITGSAGDDRRADPRRHRRPA